MAIFIKIYQSTGLAIRVQLTLTGIQLGTLDHLIKDIWRIKSGLTKETKRHKNATQHHLVLIAYLKAQKD